MRGKGGGNGGDGDEVAEEEEEEEDDGCEKSKGCDMAETQRACAHAAA